MTEKKKKRGLASNPLFNKTDSDEPDQESSNTEAQSSSGESAERTQVQENDAEGVSNQKITHQAGDQPSQQFTQVRGAHEETRQDDPDSRQRIHEPVDQSTNQSTTEKTNFSSREILGRPTAFYLYEDQSDALDDLVTHLKRTYGLKTDRSAVMRAMLTKPIINIYDKTKHQKLVNRIVQQEAARMVG